MNKIADIMTSIYCKLTILFFLMIISGCIKNDAQTLNLSDPPAWASSAIWYQIFPERFSNGSTSNDPTITTMKGALYDIIPSDWTVTPWHHEWYKQEDWALNSGKEFYTTIQMRRYGGDLKGIMDKIPYLKSIGINAIYLNPINDAPSLHKYDARNYHHVDVTFGESIEKDQAIIAGEDPADPDTWKYTTADAMFIDLIKQLHDNGIRIVMDYSWNHTGTQFWAFQDVVKNQKNSKFKDWYEIKSFDDPSTPENEFEYDGWLGIKSLPELKKIKETEKRFGYPFEGNMPEEIKQHIYAVTKRWMDPNGDGNTEDGIDGMRLDVAEHVPLGFWRDFRKYVRGINSEFYIVGENWWTSWPDTLMDAEPWMRGDVFDAVMHYQWYKPSRYLLTDGPYKIDVPTYIYQMDSIYSRYRAVTPSALMNLGSSHDTPRLLTSMANRNKYKYHATPRDDANYIHWKPDDAAYRRTKALSLLQFSYIGAPHIFNGDEMGMWGSDDPDNRKPLWWADKKLSKENFIFDKQTNQCQPTFDQDMFDHYKKLCQIRSSSLALQIGATDFIDTGHNNVLLFKRSHKDDARYVVVNSSNTLLEIPWSHTNSILYSTGDIIIKNGTMSLGQYASAILSR